MGNIYILNNEETKKEIKNMIKEEKKLLKIISPSVDNNNSLIMDLESSCDANIEFYVRKFADGSHKDIAERIRNKNKKKNINFKYIEDLHAKAYISTNRAIISSMNLGSYFFQNSYEFSIMFEKDFYEDLYNKLIDEINNINENKNDIFDKNKNKDIDFLNRDGIERAIEMMLEEEEKQIIIISPFIGGMGYVNIRELIKKSHARNIDFIVNYCYSNETQYERKIDNNIRRYETINIDYLDNKIKFKKIKNLHAKAYISSDYTIITSANFSYTSLFKNKEFGIMFNNNKYGELHSKLKNEINDILTNNRPRYDKIF